MRAAKSRSADPAYPDVTLDVGQRERRRLRLDSLALGGRQPPPGLDRDVRGVALPGPGDLAVDQERARPDARRPKLREPGSVGDQQLTLATLEEPVGVTARQESRRSRRDER